MLIYTYTMTYTSSSPFQFLSINQSHIPLYHDSCSPLFSYLNLSSSNPALAPPNVDRKYNFYPPPRKRIFSKVFTNVLIYPKNLRPLITPFTPTRKTIKIYYEFFNYINILSFIFIISAFYCRFEIYQLMKLFATCVRVEEPDQRIYQPPDQPSNQQT